MLTKTTDTGYNNEFNFATVNGVDIAWRSHGSGRPLLMLNRFRGAMGDWDPALIEALAREHRVITFDNAGVAASSGSVPSSLSGAAEFAIGLADALELEQPHVLGWSMGGMTAQVLAAMHGERIGGVVLAGTTPSFAVPGTIPLPEDWLADATRDHYDASLIREIFYTDTPVGRAACQASLERTGDGDVTAGAKLKTTVETMAGQGVATRAFFSGEDGAFRHLGAIKVPVLVANGDRDRAFAIENSIALFRAIPKSELAVYPDAGHAFLFQHADRFATDVTHFLAGA